VNGDSRRIPQPRTDDGAEMAQALWKHRHEVEVRPDESGQQHAVRIRLSPALDLRVVDSTHLQFSMATRQSWRDGGECSLQYAHFCHVTNEDKARWMAHAWRATQAARMLVALGVDETVGDAPLCRPRTEWEHPVARLLSRLRPRGPATVAEVLEDRLDREVDARLSATTPAMTTEIGSGFRVDAALYEPILAVSHPDHGTMALPGRSGETLHARLDRAREDARRALPAAAGPQSARIARVIDICREAIALDPGMTDGAGTPIRPLLEDHLPRLAARHREAMALCEPAERAAIERELDATLAVVAGAVEEGMATEGRLRRDALRTELGFLSARHDHGLRLDHD
jgi:hypothetical protein